jgi:hypothetical protein
MELATTAVTLRKSRFFPQSAANITAADSAERLPPQIRAESCDPLTFPSDWITLQYKVMADHEVRADARPE